MTDDPFLAPPPQAGQPVEPSPVSAPAPYQPPPYVPQQPPAMPPPGNAQPAYYQPGYPSPAYPPPPMAYPGQSRPKTWMNWVALGCGLGAFVTCVSFIPAIIFGHLGLAAAKRGEADQRGAGIAGLVLGYIFLALAVAYIAFIIILGVSGNLE
jgi:hypothetical protein